MKYHCHGRVQTCRPMGACIACLVISVGGVCGRCWSWASSACVPNESLWSYALFESPWPARLWENDVVYKIGSKQSMVMSPKKDQATATVNMQKLDREVCKSGFWDMRADIRTCTYVHTDRQTYRQTHRHIDHNTSHSCRGTIRCRSRRH